MRAAATYIQQAWLRRGPLAWALRPVSAVYAALAAWQRMRYRRGCSPVQRVPVPVIVVGNVVAGGAGKTPVVMAVVRHLQKQGWRVGVISRGYGRHTQEGRLVLPDSDARDVGDEPLLIVRNTGVAAAVDRNRVAAARLLLQSSPDIQVIVSDDGLQHHALARDLEICVFDDRGLGNGWLLPAGPLREAWPRPCDLVIHTGASPAFAGFRAHRALADAAIGRDGRQTALTELARRTHVVALAGIAQPRQFFDMLRARGITLTQCIALPDHHDFSAADAWPPDATLLCTEKDAAKLWRVAPHALAVPLVFEPEIAFFHALDDGLARVARLSLPHGLQAT